MQNIDGFQKVVHRKNKKKLNHYNKEGISVPLFEENINADDLIRSLLAAVVDLRKSAFTEIIYNLLSKSLSALNANTITEVICFGLGSFSKNRSSKYQLATLLSIKNQHDCKVCVFDPIFSKTEIEVLETLGLVVIKENEEGKRAITNNSLTLVFMPHCPSQLLNNFLFCNWGTQLKNCIILCNSWSKVFEQNPLGSLGTDTNYISRINPYVIETQLENKFEFTEIFSSTSIHIFQKLSETSENFWYPNKEPVYPIESTEFITKDK